MPKKKVSKEISPKIILAQITVESKSLEKNFARMNQAIKNAISSCADMIIFPEMCVSGYFNGDWWESTSVLHECEQYHEKIARLSKSIDILFGSVGIDWKNKNEDGRVRKYNAAFFAHKGKFLQNKKTKLNFWPKTLLPNYRAFDDSRYFYDLRKLAYDHNCRIEDLYEPISVTYQNKKLNTGISICEDVWDENYSISPTTLFSKKYKHDFFVNLSASPFSLDKNPKRDAVFSSQAKKLKTPFIYVNCVGTQNVGKTIYAFDGSSKVYSNKGDVILCAKFCQEDDVVFSLSELRSASKLKKIKNTESTENFSKITQQVLEYSVRKICEQWNIERVVIGVSGGIDSALTSVLFSRVLGSQNVYLVNMPTKFNADITKNAAKKLAQNLNCPYAIFPIEDIINDKKEKINALVFHTKTHKTNIQLSQLNFENIQARERGSGVLAAIASALNTVFCCNANKSEITIGYGTLYGDLSGFLCPIGDLWKHQVYALARYYNDVVFKRDIIPREIFNLPPSAELSADQDVRKGLGDPLVYEYHDHLFSAWIEQWDRKTDRDCLVAYQNNTIDELLLLPKGKTKKLFTTFEQFEKDVQRWWTLFTGTAVVKRVQAPPILAISRRAFGVDYRENI